MIRNESTQYSILPRQAVGVAAVLAAAGLVLTGCKSSTSASGSASSPAAGTAKPSASSSTGSGGSGGGQASGQELALDFPVGVGDTWVYKSDVSGISHGTITNKMTRVVPIGGGERVTMQTRSYFDGAGNSPTHFTYLFHSDGSITVPVTQFGDTNVKLVSGSILWPSSAQLSSGQPYHAELIFRTSIDGRTMRVVSHVTVKGGGQQSVTVPAGTYQAQVIDESMTEKIDGFNADIKLRTWVANGVGPVKTELLSGATTPTTVQVLKSFTKG